MLVVPKMDLATLFRQSVRLATDPWHTRWILPLVLLADAALTALVILKVPYTEIDFATYMVQARLYLKGERDYTHIEGPTGPCVYPAGHVYAYGALHWATDEGRDVRLAQWLFAGLYMLALGVVGGVYWGAKAPPYLLPLLILSKRLHSIFVLRLFNDCFAVLFLFAAIALYQRKLWNLGSIALSLGIGVKMSLLLAIPGVVAVVGQALDVRGIIAQLSIVLVVQIQLALPFLQANRAGYIARAFEFSRQFLFKWTVNWRFLGEETFLSQRFSAILLATHGAILVALGLTSWTRASNVPLPALVRYVLLGFPKDLRKRVDDRLTPDFITTTILTSVVAGMLCARSLHYQFYAYIAWSTPFLLWKAGLHPVAIYFLWAVQEWAWNVFPSTNTSSQVVVALLAVQVIGVWWGTMREPPATSKRSSGPSKEHAHVE